MSNIKSIVWKDEAEKVADAVRSDQMSLVREVFDKEMQILVLGKSGRAIAVVGKKVRPIFEAVFSEMEAGDGLFSGFSQTTRQI